MTHLPYAFAKRQGVVLAADSGEELTAFHLSEVSHLALLEVARLFGRSVKFRTVNAHKFNELLGQCYQDNAGQSHEAADFLQKDIDLAGMLERLPEPEDLLDDNDEAPVIRLINALLAEAIRENVSDIHIEPGEALVSVRFRVDGILRDVISPDKALAPLLVSRIKIMAKLDIAEKRVPQDGRISLRVGGNSIDVRVSTLPGSHGERLVLRILDKKQTLFALTQMGMTEQQIALTKNMVNQSHGIVLVTGPTGSGKTTTLYAMLNQMNKKQGNIITIEDPVEYQLEGVSQTQVNHKVELSFARGLRAILRQDPDVIMVGEIRDKETAEIAVQASLTGHLVLSTLHTNTAIGAVTRLKDMGIEPFLLSSSMIGVIAQRLVRVLCDDCKQEIEISADDLRRIDGTWSGDEKVTVYGPSGCPECNDIGYKGRTGVFEVIRLDRELQQMIHGDRGEMDLQDYAHQQSASLQSDVLRLILSGKTSFEEGLRISRDC